MDRRASGGGATAHPPARRAALRRAAQPRLLADPQPAGLGPRPHRQLRGAVAGADRGRPRAAARGARPLLRRDREPAATRGELPILRGDELRSYLDEVRERTLEVLDGVDLESAEDPLLADGFVYEMLLAHEHQHNETMLQLIQMVEGYEPVGARARPPGPARRRPGDGPGRGRGGRDRRRPGRLRLRQRAPAPRRRAGAVLDRPHPGHQPRLRRVRRARPAPSRRCTGSPTARLVDANGDGPRAEPLDPDQPVVHVSWHEADAFARWAGKRLPTEQEWEAAAAGADPERANLDQLAFGCAPAGRPRGRAPRDCGAVQMLGDVWEWTASDFVAYPGFQRLPLPRVLRGLLRRRLQGAARRRLGDPPQRDPHQLPQLGPSRAPPDLRRAPLRQGRLNRGPWRPVLEVGERVEQRES